MNGFGLIQETQNYVDYWNTLPYVRKHRKGTKVYKKALRYLNALERGRFSKTRVSTEFLKWCRRNDVDPELLFKKWTRRQIKDTLLNVSKLFDPDYAPINKNRLPKNLYQIVYDSFAFMSTFLLYYDREPELNKDAVKERKLESLTDIQRKLVLYAQKNISKARGYKIDETLVFINLLNTLRQYYKDNEQGIDYNQYAGYGQLFKRYIEWVSEEYSGFKNLKATLLFPKGTIFKKFIMSVTGQKELFDD